MDKKVTGVQHLCFFVLSILSLVMCAKLAQGIYWRFLEHQFGPTPEWYVFFALMMIYGVLKPTNHENKEYTLEQMIERFVINGITLPVSGWIVAWIVWKVFVV